MVVFGFKTFYEVFLFILSVALAITIYRLSPPPEFFLQSLIHFLNFVFVVGRKRNPENYVDYNEDAEPDEGA